LKHEQKRIEIVDSIYDNVHGYIGLTEIEKKIEKLPVFQRLRDIKQLGLTNIVFPGAEHTRYIHSLGVLYIVDKMARSLNFSYKDHQKIRLAALLHDIGHYPLSHTTEAVYKKHKSDIASTDEFSDIKDFSDYINKIRDNWIKEIQEKGQMNRQENKFERQREIINDITSEAAQPNSKHHEYISKKIILT